MKCVFSLYFYFIYLDHDIWYVIFDMLWFIARKINHMIYLRQYWEFNMLYRIAFNAHLKCDVVCLPCLWARVQTNGQTSNFTRKHLEDCRSQHQLLSGCHQLALLTVWQGNRVGKQTKLAEDGKQVKQDGGTLQPLEWGTFQLPGPGASGGTFQVAASLPFLCHFCSADVVKWFPLNLSNQKEHGWRRESLPVMSLLLHRLRRTPDRSRGLSLKFYKTILFIMCWIQSWRP